MLMTVTAAEVVVALILVWLAYDHYKAVRVETLTHLKDETERSSS